MCKFDRHICINACFMLPRKPENWFSIDLPFPPSIKIPKRLAINNSRKSV